MHKYLPYILIVLISTTVYGQVDRYPFFKDLKIDEMDLLRNDFQTLCAEFDEYFDSIESQPYSGDASSDNDFIKYSRWKNYWKDRLAADGNFPSLELDQSIVDLKSSIIKNKKTQQLQGRSLDVNWESIGPNKREGGYWGMGRVMAIAFHPWNENIFYVGAAVGGIWKTADGGKTYRSIGDDLPYNSVSNILVNKNDPNIIHITLGDRVEWDDNSLGVYYSEDGGESWGPTNLKFSLAQEVVCPSMTVSSSNPNLILVATELGIYRSEDGKNFTKVYLGLPSGFGDFNYPRQVLFSPTDPNLVYAAFWDYDGLNGGVYKSENGGLNWEKIKGVEENNVTITLAVSSIDEDRVVAKYSGSFRETVFVSENRGDSWIDFLHSEELDGEVLYISPTERNTFYTGYFYVWRSFNKGSIFNKIAGWDVDDRVHVDQWVITHNPLNNRMYWGNDGGVYSYNEQSEVWTELNDGLVITQIYDVSVSQSGPERVIMGSQDNGGAMYFSGSWTNTNGGDAMTNAMSEFDSKKFITTYPFGQEMYRTTNGWISNQRIEQNIPNYEGNASWYSPICIDPTNDDRIFAATNSIFSSNDYGTTWAVVANGISGGDRIRMLEMASDGNTCYAISETAIYYSQDAFETYSTHFFPMSITNFEIHSKDPEQIWATLSGYLDGSKIYYSSDGGENWENISNNLPNIPCHSVLYDDESDQLFLGTEVGVYRTFGTSIEWTLMTNGMPLTQVTDLEIRSDRRKIYAATFGRGLYEYDLVEGVVSTEDVSPSNLCPSFYYNSTKKNIVFDQFINDISYQISTIDGKVLFKVNGWSGKELSLADGFHANKANANGTLVKGSYVISFLSDKQICSEIFVLD